MLIRGAVEGDVEWLSVELKEFSDSFGTKLSLYGSDANAVEVIRILILEHLFLIAEKDGKPVGFITGILSPHLFNKDIRMLSECFWWIQKPHRKSRAALMLLNAFIAWGEENVDWIIFGLEESSHVSDRSMLKRGFRAKERSFFKETH